MKPCREAIPGWLFKENMLNRAGSLWVIDRLFQGPVHGESGFNVVVQPHNPVDILVFEYVFFVPVTCCQQHGFSKCTGICNKAVGVFE